MSDLKTTVQPAPQSVLYTGADAKSQFDLLFSRAFDEDSTGGVYGYKWAASPDPDDWAPTLTRINDPLELNEDDFQMVVIDSGNSSGDIWKYLYHPAAQSGTFIKEAL